MADGLDLAWGFYDDPTEERMAQVISNFAYDPATVGDDLDEIARVRLRAAMEPDVARSFAAMFPAPRQQHLDDLALAGEDLERIAQRVLLVHGRDDRLVPLDTSLFLLHHVSDVQLHVFGQCGHWTQIEHRDCFNRLLDEFLSGRI
jgi:2-hydroxymuconate-semialdehyde hydrolase